MPSLSLSFIAPQVAYARGFFREEGIDAEIIRIATNIGIVAVTTKEIGYTTAVGAGLRSAVKGLPLKVVIYFNGRPLHVLVAKPELKSLVDLRRKVIGFAGYGDSTEFMLRAMLRQAGLELEKDVQAFQVSGSGQRLQALLTGKLDAAIVPPPFNFEAESKGFCPPDRCGRCFRDQRLGLGAARRHAQRQAGSGQENVACALESAEFYQKQQIGKRARDRGLAQARTAHCASFL